jgi:hypothetical protein
MLFGRVEPSIVGDGTKLEAERAQEDASKKTV